MWVENASVSRLMKCISHALLEKNKKDMVFSHGNMSDPSILGSDIFASKYFQYTKYYIPWTEFWSSSVLLPRSKEDEY